jgi:hypothetical protein
MVRPRRQLSLLKVFLAAQVLTLEQLLGKVRCSRSTVVRRLKEHGYHSSYNQSGRFLTIPEIAGFDSRGLWFCRGARFSRFGNLKNTVIHFVESSQDGMTSEELLILLGVRCHNALLDLATDGEIHREQIGPTFIYFDRRRSHRREQIRRRQSYVKEQPQPRPTNRQVIATLLELIKDPKINRQDIVARCQRSGVQISHQLVDVIFKIYGLDKKRAP